MDRIRIKGGRPLNGTIPISGAKNATLPLMIASLLTNETLILDNVPRLADVGLLQRILRQSRRRCDGRRQASGRDPVRRPDAAHLRRQDHRHHRAYELVSRMRASFWVIAPLLARMGEAKVSMPGGCAIGTRPVDLLIMVLERREPRSRSTAATSLPAPRTASKAARSSFRRSPSAVPIRR